MKRFLLAALLCLVAQSSEAQDSFPRHNFSIGAGGAVPQADLRAAYDPKAGMSVGYGYRFHRYFQADVGMDVVFGSANVRDFVDTAIGTRRIRDYEYMLPFGGRAILPLAKGPDGYLELAVVPRLSARTGRFAASHGDLTTSGVFSRRLFRRLPATIANDKAVEAKLAGHQVWLDDVNLRIYSLNDGTRQQADTILKAR